MWNRIPKFFRSFYFLTIFFLLIWMLFFDPNDFISQYKLLEILKEREGEKAYYTEGIIKEEKEKEALLNDNRRLEQFAREKYLMKKPTEDVYVIVEKKK